MKYIFKGLSIAVLLVLNLGYANAQVVNFSLGGTVTAIDNYYGANPFGLNVGDTITATGSFDNTGFDESNWGFDAADLIEMTFTVGTGIYTLTEGDVWPSPEIVFYYDEFYDLDFSASDGEFFSSYNAFSGNYWNFEGTWHTYEEVSAVPVPAAAWLFGSGLIGLVGLARRKAA